MGQPFRSFYGIARTFTSGLAGLPGGTDSSAFAD
jgi:hypothetical protein